ncbi:hypothetical protein GEV33_006861 [Tenebrio molitor]|uniref:Uncharacterized protein n=1 Tax=Tenebrio molitor TaxID=7067 RepID=A0A8J6LCW6_TENMO|nr:hypothetical protein GEV33_006861 [Tenebrio molitor]
MLVAFSQLLWEHQMAVSSANILVLVLWMSEKGKSLQYTMYSSGESTEPWGTPAFRWTEFLHESVVPDLVECSFDVEEDTYGALAKVGVSCDIGLKFCKGVVGGALSTKAELFGGKKIVRF